MGLALRRAEAVLVLLLAAAVHTEASASETESLHGSGVITFQIFVPGDTIAADPTLIATCSIDASQRSVGLLIIEWDIRHHCVGPPPWRAWGYSEMRLPTGTASGRVAAYECTGSCPAGSASQSYPAAAPGRYSFDNQAALRVTAPQYFQTASPHCVGSGTSILTCYWVEYLSH